ncbi:dihydrolipoyl dehydrogenase family protein [Solidesulfovibrio magneticus]|uniref:Dihydrolipoyl dehydrogenase n=1 Tax=Solidesulfovibrio magneticus (strain ATCC 700980 / DSM 13731 / RS-1) TaxID=573370 RepID=C4XJC1_SOLM1|nr:FAD-dependent oxidoreductase [Solidesulfovibrio magneticus]BAH76671.1 putative dihydrolipoamide dehydrogenase [Solidesulfovibrio magneticus RS-1]
MTSSKRLVVVGAGPGGYEAALAGAAAGLDVTLIERGKLGGACLNWGCIPTKHLLAATLAVECLTAQAKQKLASGTVTPDLAAVQAKKKKLLSATHNAMAAHLGKVGVRLVTGNLTAVATGSAEVSGGGSVEHIPFDSLILALGSRPAAFPGVKPDGKAVLGVAPVLDFEAAPESFVIVGAGAIGLEIATIYHRLGTKVTLVDAAPRLAPAEDPDVSKVVAQVMRRAGIDARPGVKVESLVTDENGRARLTLAGGETVVADKALVAIGRFAATIVPGLAECGAMFADDNPNRAWLRTDDTLQTAPGIYAVGDCNGRVLLAHAASSQGVYAARHAAGLEPGPYAPGPIPGCYYGSPEIMRVGAIAAPGDTISEAPFVANPIAQAHADTAGFARVVWKDGQVAGITAVGHGASTMGTLATVMVAQAWTREQAEALVFPHPGLDETLKAALLGEMKVKA